MAVASDRASFAVGGALTFHCVPDRGCCEVSLVITSACCLMVSCCCLIDSCISLIVLSSCNILAVSGSFCGFLAGVRERWRVFASFSLLAPPLTTSVHARSRERLRCLLQFAERSRLRALLPLLSLRLLLLSLCALLGSAGGSWSRLFWRI
ncbi:hypothetical protein MRX96_037152 [Rhipicephalus microplus]